MADAPTTPKPAAAQELKAANDELLAQLESTLAALPPDERKHFFFNHKDAAALKLVNLLSARVDCIRDPAARKAFFIAHPELEVRYSANNFK